MKTTGILTLRQLFDNRQFMNMSSLFPQETLEEKTI